MSNTDKHAECGEKKHGLPTVRPQSDVPGSFTEDNSDVACTQHRPGRAILVGTARIVAVLVLTVAATGMFMPGEAAAQRAQTKAGEHGSMNTAGEFVIARVISWRKGRIVVTDEPLLNVIDAINRHSKRKLKVDRSDPRLRKLLVSGQFRADRPEVIVEYLRAAGVRVRVTKDKEGNLTLRLGRGPSHG